MQKVRFWDPEHWRFRAEETRTVADQMTHEESRTIMRRIALDYDRLAKLAEEQLADQEPSALPILCCAMSIAVRSRSTILRGTPLSGPPAWVRLAWIGNWAASPLIRPPITRVTLANSCKRWRVSAVAAAVPTA